MNKCFAASGHGRPHRSALSPNVFVCADVRDENVSGSPYYQCLLKRRLYIKVNILIMLLTVLCGLNSALGSLKCAIECL